MSVWEDFSLDPDKPSISQHPSVPFSAQGAWSSNWTDGMMTRFMYVYSSHINLELKLYLDFVICFNSYSTIRSQWTHTTLSIHGLANTESHRINWTAGFLQLQIWYRLAEFEELALSAMMGLRKEELMVVCLSDVNTILSFHALLRLLGDRGLKILNPLCQPSSSG